MESVERSDGRQNAHDAVLRAPLTASVARIHRVDFVEFSQNALLEELGGRIGIGVRAALGLRDDAVDHAELEAVSGVGFDQLAPPSALRVKY